MTITVRDKADLVVPPSVRRRAGLKPGDQVEFRVSGGVINIVPKLPAADDEYTPAQRRIIDAQLDEAEKGPFHGPFKTAGEAIKFLHKEIRARKARRKAS
jgi:AbrB family looped-hinge helix DNA binding protein